ncbi:hypothetical protein BB558_006450 [Smittium angustum]|uniref:DUF3835 domain-containing protein n=2 Tax=Smittium angustum TaxID=133377 RepID=A0A2U1IXP3_SMIAN|nr:hypothetical protein BB558_006450 [Smittium angustum]
MDQEQDKSVLSYYKAELDHQKSLLDQHLQFKNDYSSLQSTLLDLPNEIEYDAMLPIGEVAFIPGKIVKTNQILILLGDNWFVERSAKQASEIAGRRKDYVQEKINLLQKQVDALKSKTGMLSDEKDLEHHAVNEEGDPIFEIKEDYTETDENLYNEQIKKWDSEHIIPGTVHKPLIQELSKNKSVIDSPVSSITPVEKLELRKESLDEILGREEAELLEILKKAELEEMEEKLEKGYIDDSNSSSYYRANVEKFMEESENQLALEANDSLVNSDVLKKYKTTPTMKLNEVFESNNPLNLINDTDVDVDGPKSILKKQKPKVSLFKERKTNSQTTEKEIGRIPKPRKSVLFNENSDVVTFNQHMPTNSVTGNSQQSFFDEIKSIGTSTEQSLVDNTNRFESIESYFNDLKIVETPIQKPNLVEIIDQEYKEKGVEAGVKKLEKKGGNLENKSKAMKDFVFESKDIKDYDEDTADFDILSKEETYNQLKKKVVVYKEYENAKQVAENVLSTIPGQKLVDSIELSTNDSSIHIKSPTISLDQFGDDEGSELSKSELLAKKMNQPPVVASESKTEKDQGVKRISRFKQSRLGRI